MTTDVRAPGAGEVLAFGKWSLAGIKVDDPGLVNYVTLQPKFVPRTGGKYAGRRFHKSKIFIVERLINKLFVPGHKAKKHMRSSGHCTGNATNAYSIVENAFKIVEQRIKKNPIEVFVKALENGAQREEIVSIEYGGARYPKAVDCTPQRRVDVALRFFVQGTYDKSFNKKKSAQEALAEEIMFAYQLSPNSLAIQKKLEIERQADGSR